MLSGVASGRLEADQSLEMTKEQMIHRAKRAEQLRERLTEVEQEREATGLYEEALEARRLCLEHEAAAFYWRSRASGGTP
jgi:hypothetical protein